MPGKPRRRVGGKPPRPPRPKAIKVSAPKSISPVLDDAVARAKRIARGFDEPATIPTPRASRSSGSTSPRGPRTRPALPSAADLFGGDEGGSGAYDDEVIGGGGGGVSLREFDTGNEESYDDTAEDQRARRSTYQRTVSPAQTSNANRPRALEYKYDEARQVLTVTFREGGTYEYEGVERRVFYNLTRVKSTGKFIDRNIKGVYKYTKISA